MGIHEQETVPLSHTGGSLGLAVREINAPRQLGSVRLIREIGKGGMGVVWLGHDEMLGRDVAVKFVLGAAASEDDPHFAVFLDGARAAAKLKCPGMTAVFHADVVNGAPYIVMEYVDGPTVSRVISRTGPLSAPAALAVMLSVCGTVAELHDAGIIHRDIKPSNVMLDTDCRVFLTDFGIAICRPVGESGTDKVGVAGTPAYMAPEAFDGYASTRTDTYALGMMFYELVTGDAPFEGEYSDVRDMHKSRELPGARLAELRVEPAMVEIIQRATHKDPKFRYKSARHMLEAIERAPLPRAMRQRAESELRAAALKCRAGGDMAAGGKDGTGGTPSPRSLYDHLSTLAAKKRSDIPTPGDHPETQTDADAPSDGDSPTRLTPTTHESKTASIPMPTASIRNFACPKCAARFSTASETAACPSCGTVMLGPTSPSAAQREDDEDMPLKPTTVAWIGFAVFAVCLMVFAVWYFYGQVSKAG